MSPYPDNRGMRRRVGPPNFVRIEQIAPVSRRREIHCPDTMMATHGSLLELVVVRPRESRPLQLSMPRPKRLAGG